MANIKSAIKRARQNVKRRAHNTSARSMYRTYVKNVLKAIESGDASEANNAYIRAQSVVDRAAGSGLIHKNKASRIKSRLVTKLKALATSA